MSLENNGNENTAPLLENTAAPAPPAVIQTPANLYHAPNGVNIAPHFSSWKICQSLMERHPKSVRNIAYFLLMPLSVITLTGTLTGIMLAFTDIIIADEVPNLVKDTLLPPNLALWLGSALIITALTAIYFSQYGEKISAYIEVKDASCTGTLTLNRPLTGRLPIGMNSIFHNLSLPTRTPRGYQQAADTDDQSSLATLSAANQDDTDHGSITTETIPGYQPPSIPSTSQHNFFSTHKQPQLENEPTSNTTPNTSFAVTIDQT